MATLGMQLSKAASRITMKEVLLTTPRSWMRVEARNWGQTAATRGSGESEGGCARADGRGVLGGGGPGFPALLREAEFAVGEGEDEQANRQPYEPVPEQEPGKANGVGIFVGNSPVPGGHAKRANGEGIEQGGEVPAFDV